jgi:hypothetical protein
MADGEDMTGQLAVARWRARWARLNPLGRSVTVVLIVKFAALGLLWWAFFSHPLPRQLPVDLPRVDAAPLAASSGSEQSAHAHR